MQAAGPELPPSLAGQYIAIVSVPRLIAAGVNLGSPAAITTWLASNAPDYVTATPATLSTAQSLGGPGRLSWSITGVVAERYFLCYGPSSTGPWTLVGGGNNSWSGQGAGMPQEARLFVWPY